MDTCFKNNLLISSEITLQIRFTHVTSGVRLPHEVTSGSLGDEMISTLAWNERDVGSIPALGPFSSHPRQYQSSKGHVLHCFVG